MSLSRKRWLVDLARGKLGVLERRTCQVLGQLRSNRWRKPVRADNEAALTEAIIRLATRFEHYGYRRIISLLRAES